MRTLLSTLLLTVPALAQDSERAFLVVDPDDAESRYVANHYLDVRAIPARNVLFMDPGASSYVSWTSTQLPGFLGALRNKGLEDTVDFVILPPGDRFFVPASGLISDSCSPVNRFALPSCFTLTRQAENILGGLGVNSANHYKKGGWGPRAFQSTVTWRFGDPSSHNAAERYYIGAMLGWTGQNGNTLQEVLDTIDRSVAVDGSLPGGTFYYMQTTDNARSGPRHGTYPGAAAEILARGGQAQHLMDVLPLGNHDGLGVMTGWASPNIADPNFSILPGSFCDHLTSFAGTFDNNSQTKMSEWISKGASGTAGTVEEPCNYAGKFPHALMHVVYFRGLTLGEAWFRSMGFKPFQELLLGDPLTRPFGQFPIVDVPSPPIGPQSGVITITPSASATSGANATIEVLDLFVDGLLVDSIPGGNFQLDTTLFADGWHDLRVRAVDDKIWRNQNHWVGALEIDNDPGDVTLNAVNTSGDLGTLFDLDFVASGAALDEVVLIQHERVIASSDQASGVLSVHGQNTGAGLVHVQAEARFTDGTRARSQVVDLNVAFAGGGGGGSAPLAHSFTRWVREDEAFVLALPATYDDDPAAVSTTLLTTPDQSTLLGGDGSWRVFEPSPDALGSDTLTYQVTGAGGTSNVATVTIVYADVDGCLPVQSYCVAAPNSAGAGALMDHSGSVSIAANDLTLQVSGAPAGQFGLFFYGQGPVQIPLGDGFLCVSSNIIRFPVVTVQPDGTIDQPVDYSTLPPGGTITPGSTWGFQFWFRDPPFGGAGFNLSDAIEATFCS